MASSIVTQSFKTDYINIRLTQGSAHIKGCIYCNKKRNNEILPKARLIKRLLEMTAPPAVHSIQ